MPCRHDESPEERAQAQKDQVCKSRAYINLQGELNRVTALLCDACKLLENSGVTIKEHHKHLGTWWTKHKVIDDDRLRRQALAKLTPAERAVLKLT